jgi:hypothetical protein
VPLEWRHGNLAVFMRTRLNRAPRPVLPAADAWDEEALFGVRVRLRQRRAADFEEPTLLSIVPGDILPSVSRRDPRRRLVDIWTSGNRVFACRGTPVLRMIARALAEGRSPADGVATGLGQRLTPGDVDLVSRAAQQLMNVVGLEREENTLLGDNWDDGGLALAADC